MTGAITGTYSGTYAYNAIGNITSTSRLGSYVYTATAASCAAGTPSTKPHAVSRAGSNAYTYDCNGNMTQRVEVSGTQRITYTQSWDKENRLTVVTHTAVVPNLVSKFIYDGDGTRVLQVQISGTQVMTTAYASAIEVQITATQRITKAYYSAGSQLIAMRVYTAPTSSVLYYLHSDHLGSTSLTTNASGGVVARQLYDAWGNVRSSSSKMPTDIGYTGQRGNLEVGLLFYRARFYVPSLGRFLSADTIVPSPNDPQSLNRFSYTRNNPLNSIDPSGHVDCDMNLWGNTCQSSSAHEKEQADNNNALCAYDQAACQWGTNAGEIGTMLLIGGIGLFGGALVGTGAKLIQAAIATGSTTTGLIGTGLVGGGTGMLVGGGATIASETMLGQKLDPSDILINSVSTGGAGFVAGIIPGSSGWAIGLRALFNGLFAATASEMSDYAHGRSVNVEKAALSGIAATVLGTAAYKIRSLINPATSSSLNNPMPYSSAAGFVASWQANHAVGFGLFNAFTIQAPLKFFGALLVNRPK